MSSERFAFAVPFRELVPTVDDWRERACTSKPSHGVPPHVTLLIPAPSDVDAATAALEPFAPFEVTFSRFGRFPDTLWLAPEPSEPFVSMTQALLRAFPEHTPYEGLFDEITPHLTVAQGAALDAAEESIRPRLPRRALATSVVLFEQIAPNRWRVTAELEL